MKKVLPILLVAAMALPVWADVAVTTDVSVPGELTVTITPSGDAAIRGAALEFVTEAGFDAAILAATDVSVTNLNTNIDFFYTNGLGLVSGDTPNGEGHAVAKIDAAGAIDDSADNRLPASAFAVSAGFLDDTGAQLGQTLPIVITIAYDLSMDSDVTIDENALRGGIVGDDLGTITGLPVTVTVLDDVPQECVKSTAPFYQTWVDFGKPDCWCYQRNCRGDVNGLKSGYTPATYVWVNSQDLQILAAAFNKFPSVLQTVEVNGVKGICADNNRAKSGYTASTYVWVNSQDLTEFAKYFNKFPVDVPVCDQTHYNFWTN